MPSLITAELPTWLTDTGALVAIISGVLLLAALVTRSRPVRAVWRRLVSDPITDWQTSIIRSIVDPVAADSAQLRASLEGHMAMEEQLRAVDAVDRDRRQNEMDSWRDEVREDIASIKGTMATKADVRTVHGRIDTALARLAVGNPELRAVPPLTIPTPAEFDAATAPEWSQMTGELDVSGDVVVDMAATTLCDSAGIGAMVHLAQRTDVAGGSFSVVNVSPNVVRSVKILSLGTVLGIE